MTGEQHERAVEAAGHLLDQSGLTHEQTGPPAVVVARDLIDTYLSSLKDQGVVLVGLREVVEFVRREDRSVKTWSLADVIERRFGGNERSA